MYGKYFAKTFEGSMYGAGFAVFAVWSYAIANADIQGFVELNPKALADKLGGPEADVETAIEFLRAPDEHSRTKTEGGRRLVREGQFLHRIVNYEVHRKIWSAVERREYMRTYMKEYRKGDRRRDGKESRTREGITAAQGVLIAAERNGGK